MVLVVVYEDSTGRRFVDVEGDHEGAPASVGGEHVKEHDVTKIDGKPIKIPDLLEAGILEHYAPPARFERALPVPETGFLYRL